LDETDLERLLAWQQCQNCMTVSELGDGPPLALDACPGCGETGFEVRWPPDPVRLLIRKALRLEVDDDEDLAVSGLLVATALDIMTTWLLDAALTYYSADSRRAARLVDRVRDPELTTEQRLDLLREVADLDFKRVAATVDAPELPARWRELREARDGFTLSFDAQAFQAVSRSHLLETVSLALRVFARLNSMIY
jgi:hypothetical protein